MIKIRFDKNEITALGHSGYAETGKDVVCASVSASFMFALTYLNKRNIPVKLGVDASIAFLGIQFEGNDAKKRKKWSEIKQVLVESLELIKDEYPDYISIEKC